MRPVEIAVGLGAMEQSGVANVVLARPSRAAFQPREHVVIRSYQAEHGGTVFYAAPSRRQKTRRTRLMALMVITVVAASAGVVHNLNARSMPIEMLAPTQ